MSATRNAITEMRLTYATATDIVKESRGLVALGTVKHFIKTRHKNGLAKCGCTYKVGTRILLNREKFSAWMAAHQEN